MIKSDDLYFIQVKDGPVKIGRTRLDPLRRMALLQVGCPYELLLLGTIAGEGDAELLIHMHLEEYRMRGEWFEWSEEVANLVRDLLAGKDWRSVVGPRWYKGSPLFQPLPKR